ncbi:hypothetical protein R5R35_003650 [Gryllus longicercus]|uniref:Serine protease K12H4.7 n=1 Tax=Gryllus longicercus TaxID=2509291 RepID=A0AAN9Z5F8_9ORTH
MKKFSKCLCFWSCWTTLLLAIVTVSAQDVHSKLRLLPPQASPGIRTPKRRWFSQVKDHFSGDNKTIWHQKFFYSDDFFKPGGPVFLYVGGEFELSSSFLSGGHIIEMAAENNAFLLGLEHRYYGESFPTAIKNIPKSLALLNVDQALADLAYFVENVAELEEFRLLSGARWIAIGCSYPGMLAAWLRAKYPHLVYAAVASSAPVLAKTEFPEYEDVVARVLRDSKPGCLESIQKASHAVREFQASDNSTYLDELFPDVLNDVLKEVNDMISTIVQINILRTLRPVELACSIMTNDELGSPLERYSTLWKRFKRRYFDESLNDLVYIAWRYQTCTEFGYNIVTSSISKYPYHVKKLDKWISDECSIFGPGFDSKRVEQGVAAINAQYGGKQPNVSRVVYTNGADDPWSALGITSEVPGEDNHVIVIAGEPHCVDFLPSSGRDSPALRAARRRIRSLVKKWATQRGGDNLTTKKPTKIRTKEGSIVFTAIDEATKLDPIF